MSFNENMICARELGVDDEMSVGLGWLREMRQDVKERLALAGVAGTTGIDEVVALLVESAKQFKEISGMRTALMALRDGWALGASNCARVDQVGGPNRASDMDVLRCLYTPSGSKGGGEGGRDGYKADMGDRHHLYSVAVTVISRRLGVWQAMRCLCDPTEVLDSQVKSWSFTAIGLRNISRLSGGLVDLAELLVVAGEGASGNNLLRTASEHVTVGVELATLLLEDQVVDMNAGAEPTISQDCIERRAGIDTRRLTWVDSEEAVLRLFSSGIAQLDDRHLHTVHVTESMQLLHSVLMSLSEYNRSRGSWRVSGKGKDSVSKPALASEKELSQCIQEVKVLLHQLHLPLPTIDKKSYGLSSNALSPLALFSLTNASVELVLEGVLVFDCGAKAIGIYRANNSMEFFPVASGALDVDDVDSKLARSLKLKLSALLGILSALAVERMIAVSCLFARALLRHPLRGSPTAGKVIRDAAMRWVVDYRDVHIFNCLLLILFAPSSYFPRFLIGQTRPWSGVSSAESVVDIARCGAYYNSLSGPLPIDTSIWISHACRQLPAIVINLDRRRDRYLMLI